MEGYSYLRNCAFKTNTRKTEFWPSFISLLPLMNERNGKKKGKGWEGVKKENTKWEK
jgi:hypothetical protein